jgi:5-methylthioadenosine/S-adenosylhomocysteine deaminase
MTTGAPRTCLINGHIVTVDPDDTDFAPGYLLIEGSRIVGLGPMADYRPAGDVDELDCTGKFIFPGLVNTHTHSFQTLIRGVGEGLPVWEWFSQALDAVVGNITVDDAERSAQVSALEAIRSGTTCILDYNYPHPQPGMADAAIRGFKSVGIRVILARGIIDCGDVHSTIINDTDAELEDCQRLINMHHKSDDDTVRVWVAPYTVFSTSRTAFSRAVHLARAHGTGITIHAATPSTLEAAHELFGSTDIAYEKELGALGSNMLLVHCTHLSPVDITTIAESAACVSHNPASNAYLGEGTTPVIDLMSRGIVVGLGTDGPASNNNQDMIAVMKLTALLQKLVHQDPGVISARTVLRLATMGGATCLGWSDEIGSLEVGKRADLIIVNPWLPNTVTFGDPVASLVYSATQENVETVLVNGRFIMKNRLFAELDVADILACAQREGTALRSRSGLA